MTGGYSQDRIITRTGRFWQTATDDYWRVGSAVMDVVAVRALVDEQLRRPDGAQVGAVVRALTHAGNWINHSALTADTADAAIAEQVAFFAERGEPFEWKHYGHDTPADLPDRLLAAGFVPEPAESLLVAEVAAIPPVPLVDGLRLEPVTDKDGFAAIGGLQEAVWGAGRDHSAALAREHADDPSIVDFFRVLDGDVTVCAAWIRYHGGTPFASLWGGSTLPAWRRRGIYRALVAHRAALAAARGYRYLQVDASDDSRPILQRLGFTPLTTTTPYIWTPPMAAR
jgi:ribosomal protein S18 acetylase RimI-like enzyme